MNPLDKKEAIGIFASVAIMAIALSVIRFQTNVFTSNAASESQVASVTSVQDVPDAERQLEDSAVGAADPEARLLGLIVDDIKIGTGASVEEGDTVVTHYVGATQDGTRFDSSYERGQPFEFTVGGGEVIEGWEKGLMGMKVGGQRVLVIPGDMAYGNMQVGVIPPNASLVFAIELLEIK